MMIFNFIVLNFVFWAAGSAGHWLDTKALIEQALDEPTRITLENVKLTDALAIVSEQTGVKIVMPPEVVYLVPDGADTIVAKVDLAGMPLRQGLATLFGPLGMSFVVADDHVRIVPRSALLCLGRAPTWAELDLLAQLSALQPGTDSAAFDELKSYIQFQGGPQLSWETLRPAIESVGVGSGDEVLTIACTNLGWAWCLSDQRIVVTPIEVQIQRHLQTPINVRINNRALEDVLAAVAEQTGVRVRAEPGALASLPPPMQQNFSLNASRLPAEQVLEKIANATGLGFLIGADGVVFYQPAMHAGKAPDDGPSPSAVGRADPYVAKFVIQVAPDKSIEWLIRASELPPDLKEMRQRDLQEVIDAARQRATNLTP